MPTILPGCPAYYSSHSATKRTRLSIDDKDDELLYQAVSLSLEAEVEENKKFRIQNLHDLQAKLHFISIANIWSTWYPDEYTLIFCVLVSIVLRFKLIRTYQYNLTCP